MKTFWIKLILGFFLCIYAISANAVDFYETGKTYYYKQDYQNAKLNFQKAVAQKPLNYNYRYYYAQSLTFLGDLKKAQSEYEKIIEISPESQAAKYSVIAISNIQKHYDDLNNQNYQSTSSYSDNAQISGDNYLSNAVSSNGEILVWNAGKMPLKIYFIAKKYDAASIEYMNKVKQAFAQWQKATKGKLTFEYTNDKSKANIIISFENSLSANDSKQGYTSGLAKPYTENGYMKYATVRFATQKPNNTTISSTELYGTALHEIGHAIGIWGHSENKKDVMYAVADESSQKNILSLSERDINTINILYSPKDTFAANSKKDSANLGTKEERLQKKLQESLDYVKQVPNDPISWTQLGNAYLELNKYTEAAKNFEKALSLNPNYKNAYSGLAQVYTKTNDIYKAEKNYNFLIKNEPKEIINYHNLAVLYIQNKQYSQAKNTINKLFYNNSDAKQDKGIQNLLQIIEKESN